MNVQTKIINGCDVSIYFRDVTPQLASSILAEHNTKNRKVLRSHVAALAKNMEEGTWYFNGDTIRFDNDGVLIDGQHRLMAIVKSGCTIPCLFVVGLEPNVIKCIDIEMKPRNLKNLLEMDFVKNAGIKATTIRRYFSLREGLVALSNSEGSQSVHAVPATMETQYNFYNDNVDVVTQVTALGAALNKRTQLLPAGDIAAIALLLIHDNGYHYDMVKDFFDAIMLGSPIQMLNEVHLALTKNMSTMKKMTGLYKQSYLAKAWNYYAQGKFVKQVRYNPNTDGKVMFK